MGVVLACAVCAWDTLSRPADPTGKDSTLLSPGVLADEGRLDDRDIEDLAWLLTHPVDLNHATEAELVRCCLVSAAEASDILLLRGRLGGFSRLGDLRVLGGDLVERLEPYAFVGTRRRGSGSPAGEPGVEVRLRASQEREKPEGGHTAWLGSSIRQYGRVVVRPYHSVEIGALAEKDAGERWRDGLVSGYATLRDLGPLAQLTFGDYVVEAGQGLLLGRKSTRSSDWSVPVGRVLEFARVSRYTDESAFFRGVAATAALPLWWQGGAVDVSGFLSRRERDAAIGDGVTAGALYDEGLFRSASELARRGTVCEEARGLRVQVTVDQGVRMGLSWYESQFNRPLRLVSGSEAISQRSGSMSADFLFRTGGIAFTGEFAPSSAALAVTMRSRPQAEFAAGIRLCGPGGPTLHASSPARELAAFAQWNLSPFGRLRILGSLGHSRLLREARSANSTLQKSDLIFQADVALTREADLNVRWRRRISETVVVVPDSLSRDVRRAVSRSGEALRSVLSAGLATSLTLRLRWEVTRVSYPLPSRGSTGYLLSQQLSLDVAEGCAVSACIALFDTEDYESRTYQLEDDVRGAFSMPPLHGKGRRWYVCARWRCADATTISAKYASTEISWRSGVHRPLGDTSITAQLDVCF